MLPARESLPIWVALYAVHRKSKGTRVLFLPRTPFAPLTVLPPATGPPGFVFALRLQTWQLQPGSKVPGLLLLLLRGKEKCM